MNQHARKYWTALLIWVSVLATLGGALLTLDHVAILLRFGGTSAVIKLAALRIVLIAVPGIAVSATALAVVTWTHYLSPEQLELQRRNAIGLVVTAWLVALPVAALFAFVSSFAVATVATGVGLTEFLTDVSEALRWSDLLGALRVLGVNAGLFGVTWWLAMPALVRSRASLRAKLAVTFVGVFVIQLLLNLML